MFEILASAVAATLLGLWGWYWFMLLALMILDDEPNGLIEALNSGFEHFGEAAALSAIVLSLKVMAPVLKRFG